MSLHNVRQAELNRMLCTACGHPVTAATPRSRAPAFPSPPWVAAAAAAESKVSIFNIIFARSGVDAVNGSGAAGEVRFRCEGDAPDLEERDDHKVR